MKKLAILLTLVSAPSFADYTLVSAPRGDEKSETARYAPVAAEMSKLLGVKVNYKYVGGWSPYTKGILKDEYDFVFDGPHYVSFRQTYREHKMVARLVEPLSFVVIVRQDSKFKDLKSLSGRRACLHASPNLATTLFLNNYEYVTPSTVLIQGFPKAFDGVVNGNCAAAVVTVGNLKKMNNDNLVKVIYQFPALPNQALTASYRVPSDMVDKLGRYMISDQCVSCSKILDAFNSKGFTAPIENDYIGLSKILMQDSYLGKEIQTKVAISK